MATVYLICQPSVDKNGKQPRLEDLARFGQVRVILQAGDAPTRRQQRCIARVDHALADFVPEVDYLVWAGGETLSALMVGFILREQGIQRFQWLKYGNPKDPHHPGQRLAEGTYTPVWIDLRDPDVPAGDTTALPTTPTPRKAA